MSAAIWTVTRLEGGQNADAWRVDTENPACSVIIRQFSVADDAGAHEQRVLQTLDGLGGLAPVLLGGDVNAQWSEHPTTVISWLDGQAGITPTDPQKWADELGRALAVVHEVPSERRTGLPSVFDRSGGSQDALDGPLARRVRSRWAQVTEAPQGLTHTDYWSGNVVWRAANSRASSTGRAGPAVHAPSTWAGFVSISFSSSTSKLPTSSSGL